MKKEIQEIVEQYEHRGTKLVNLEKIAEFFQKNLKMPYGVYDLNACIEDVIVQRGASGCNIYELSSFETKSGNPECYSYEYEYEWDEEYDQLKSETFIF